MATLLLQTVGTVAGALLGPVGAMIGRAVGALAGSAIDQLLFGDRGAEPRAPELQTSREGAAIPRVYGRARITGQVIWTAPVESGAEAGGKGFGGRDGEGFYGSFAVGLCEGPIARVGRVWADGRELDLPGLDVRFHLGTEAQEPDALIEAAEGEEAPAYRGLAYAVFERLPLAEYGNRLPQLAFEVIRLMPGIEQRIRAVTVIPGATEFGYDPAPVSVVRGPGSRADANRHVLTARTDWAASIDELQAVCPNLESVALVVTWFGDDLRAGECTIRPGVVADDTTTVPDAWTAGGVGRGGARVVSEHDGAAAYGGTPSDASIVRAIADLHGRGLRVAFYPIVMMDVPAGNGLPDPYGGAEQGAYPWRGRITASVAPGEPGTPDQTPDAADEIAAFVGDAEAGDFAVDGVEVGYGGPAEWSYRRMILHYAHLCAAAGGVDTFLIGSELRGLTTLRSGPSTYPFVTALAELAADVRGILGGETAISYAADWSEYFGHQPADGSGDVHFHLDPLWADPEIDFVGIDAYAPLADWRDGDGHLDAADWHSGRELGYLRANIAGGEGFGWHYASDADRAAQTRTPITDGAYGKPWVFRYKDLASWWGNVHYDRPGGVEAGAPTAWVAQGKPIRFTETGCAAVERGANEPSRFPDSKSVESGLPHHSTGGRDETIQRRFVEAMLGWFDPDDPDYVAGANPESTEYDGRMVEHGETHVWTWDARPFPAFPLRPDAWADAANWNTGHWLNGRLGGGEAGGLVAAVLADHGFEAAAIGEVEGVVDGYLVDAVASGRQVLEPLADLLSFEAAEAGDRLRFVPRQGRAVVSLTAADLVEEDDRPLVTIRRAQETELPAEVAFGFSDPFADYRPAAVGARRLAGASRRLGIADTGLVMRYDTAAGLAERKLREIWDGRETVSFALPPSRTGIEPGDVVRLDAGAGARDWFVTRIEEAGLLRIEARAVVPDVPAAAALPARGVEPAGPVAAVPPDVILLDLPVQDEAAAIVPHVCVFADPWPGPMAVQIGTAETGFALRQVVSRRATVGETLGTLWSGPVWRWDRVNSLEVRLRTGSPAAAEELAVLNGANLAAIGSEEDGWEILQFAEAELIAPLTYRLSGLLRGLGGTEDVTALGRAAGATFVLLDGAVVPLELREHEAGLALTVRTGPAGFAYDPGRFADRDLLAAERAGQPLAPVRVKGRRDPATGDWALTWMRRSRSAAADAWEPVDVPLAEEAEGYELEVLDGGDVVRTATGLAARSFDYTAAMQTADFGTAQWDLSIRVFQISPARGRGVPGPAYVWNFEADA